MSRLGTRSLEGILFSQRAQVHVCNLMKAVVTDQDIHTVADRDSLPTHGIARYDSSTLHRCAF